jgi:hypothetical protein
MHRPTEGHNATMYIDARNICRDPAMYKGG